MREESNFKIDALLPPEMAKHAEDIGVKKASMDAFSMFMLAILAGAFIGMGAELATIAITGAKGVIPFGITKLLGGFVFSLGLILVIIAGAELFTGNNLIVMAVASGKVSRFGLLRNWGIVYVGNFVGALLTVGIIYISRQYEMGPEEAKVGLTALAIANSKCGLGFFQAVALGIFCNALVCVAVWLCFSARTTTDRILSIIFPITAFVASGFEHCVANMYFIPIGMMLKNDEAFLSSIGKTSLDFPNLTMEGFLINNLLPVTIGNIIGGSLLVAGMYWMIYRRSKASQKKTG